MDLGSPLTYRFGEFVLDIGARRLSGRDGHVVALRPLVFDTLSYLVRHHGVVVGKQELMHGVWGHAFIEENNLNQHVSVLRRALGDTRGEPRYIATLPRRGYCFVADVDGADPDVDVSADSVIRSLAILPFQALTPGQRDEALEMGMADALIMRLSAMPDMIVRPLASARRYAGAEKDVRQIGGELGVDALLDGSIERVDTQVRVSARLLHCTTGRQMWASQFDAPWTDLFAVQDAISERVAEAVSAQLNPGARAALARRPTASLEAYELYLRGRYHAAKLTPEEFRSAADFYRRAVEVEPEFALAHFGVADLLRSCAIAGDVPPHEVFPQAKAAIARALRIDPQCAEALALRGFVALWYDWDWVAAERDLQKAISLNSNYADAHVAYSHLLSHMGRHDDALAQIERARTLDPLSLRINALEGMFLFYARHFDDARTRLRRALELEPTFWIANIQLAKVQIAQRQFDAAERSLAIAAESSGGNSEVTSVLVFALGAAGHAERADAALHALEQTAAERYVPPYNLAIAHLGVNNIDAAFEWLEHAYTDRDVRLTSIKVEPKWDSVRSDPRFVDLLQRLRLQPAR